MGLDLSLRGAGVVVLDREGNRLFEGTFGHQLEKDALERDKVERVIDICRKIVGVAKEYLTPNRDAVVIESHAFNRFSKSASVTGLAELHGAVKVQLHLESYVNPVYATESQVRNAVLGVGWSKGLQKKGQKGWKKKAFKALLEGRGHTFQTDDEMDAWALCQWALKSSGV